MLLAPGLVSSAGPHVDGGDIRAVLLLYVAVVTALNLSANKDNAALGVRHHLLTHRPPVASRQSHRSHGTPPRAGQRYRRGRSEPSPRCPRRLASTAIYELIEDGPRTLLQSSTGRTRLKDYSGSFTISRMLPRTPPTFCLNCRSFLRMIIGIPFLGVKVTCTRRSTFDPGMNSRR